MDKPKTPTQVKVYSPQTSSGSMHLNVHEGATKYSVDSNGTLWVNNSDGSNVAAYARGGWSSAMLA